VNLAVHFIRARSSLILNYSSEPFLLYYATCWNGGREEDNCGWDRKWGKLIGFQ